MAIIAGMSNFYNDVNYEKFISLYPQKGFSFVHESHYSILSTNKTIPSKEGYMLLFNGRIENKFEMMQLVEDPSEETYLIDLYLKYGTEFFKKLEGPFVIGLVSDKEIVIARDQMGLLSLYYTVKDQDLFFSTELGSLVKYLNLNKIDKDGIAELLGMGPTSSIGKTVYKDVFCLDGGEYLVFNKELNTNRFFSFEAEYNNLDYFETKQEVRKMIDDIIKKQREKQYGCFVSGGLDSTVIMSQLDRKINTYSMQYTDNNFKSNDFLVSNDLDYIDYVTDMYESKNHLVPVDSDELIEKLNKCLDLRGYPGMVDVDSSLLLLMSKAKEDVIFSGECGDEVFSGYPWCYKEVDENTFPWLRNVEVKDSILKEEYKGLIIPYIDAEYQKAKSTFKCNNHKQLINYLNLKYFLPNLALRQEKMSLGANKDIRNPFGSYKLAQFMLNVPYDYKFANNEEKGLLREIFKEEIPAEIYNRKKSPYPKTHSRVYEDKIRDLVYDCFEDKNSLLNKLFDFSSVKKLKEMDMPWCGQLLTLPQLYAYMYQIHYWGYEYNIEICE